MTVRRSCRCRSRPLRSIVVKLLRRSLLALFVFALALSACGGGDARSAQVKRPATTTAPATTTTRPAPTTTTVPPYISYIASVRPEITSIGVYPSPETPEPSQTLPNPWLYEAGNPASAVPQVFLVESQRPDGWVQVLLPVRPNGSVGWVHLSDVTLTANPFHIDVSLSCAHDHRHQRELGHLHRPRRGGCARHADADRQLLPLRAAPGARSERTVRSVRVRLSSHSDALETFAGGDAEIGIHGNDDTSALGQSVSHGCIRMDNAAITDLSKQLPLGTPVAVNA